MRLLVLLSALVFVAVGCKVGEGGKCAKPDDCGRGLTCGPFGTCETPKTAKLHEVGLCTSYKDCRRHEAHINVKKTSNKLKAEILGPTAKAVDVFLKSFGRPMKLTEVAQVVHSPFFADLMAAMTKRGAGNEQFSLKMFQEAGQEVFEAYKDVIEKTLSEERERETCVKQLQQLRESYMQQLAPTILERVERGEIKGPLADKLTQEILNMFGRREKLESMWYRLGAIH